MTWDWLPEPSTFEKARRREAYRRLARIVRGRTPRACPQELVPLEDVMKFPPLTLRRRRPAPPRASGDDRPRS